jgi:tetratricopeptide (TPR) repeat protein
MTVLFWVGYCISVRRKRLFWRAFVVIALLILTVSNWPTDELASLRTQVSQLYSRGTYAEAAPIAERYVALARQKHGDNHTEYATAIDWLAKVYEAQGRYSEAEPLNKRALAIDEKATLGPDHPDVTTSLTKQAAHCRCDIWRAHLSRSDV